MDSYLKLDLLTCDYQKLIETFCENKCQLLNMND